MTVKCESGLLSICAADAPQFSSAVYNQSTQARKLQAGAAQSGRSLRSICSAETQSIFERRVQKRTREKKMTSLCLQSGLLSICATDAPQFSSAVYNQSTQARKLQAGAAQSGRSMIEMLGVLAIIGVLVLHPD
ncbi:MAG: hypothetical protein J6N49_03615 [Alphaproteobacteria bacterium]|nr:hypothetical protein [Alphaproteobacteria bacterium]